MEADVAESRGKAKAVVVLAEVVMAEDRVVVMEMVVMAAGLVA